MTFWDITLQPFFQFVVLQLFRVFEVERVIGHDGCKAGVKSRVIVSHRRKHCVPAFASDFGRRPQTQSPSKMGIEDHFSLMLDLAVHSVIPFSTAANTCASVRNGEQ